MIVDEEHHKDRSRKDGAWHRNDQLVAATRGHATSRTHWAAATSEWRHDRRIGPGFLPNY